MILNAVIAVEHSKLWRNLRNTSSTIILKKTLVCLDFLVKCVERISLKEHALTFIESLIQTRSPSLAMFVRDPSTNPRTCRHTRRRCTQVQHLPTNFLFTKYFFELKFFVKLFRDRAINTTFGLIQLPVSPSTVHTGWI